MENTERAPSKIQLQDSIQETIEQAKAIVHLMAVAARDDSMEHDSEIRWAERIHLGLLNEMDRLIKQFSATTGEIAA